MAGVHTLALPRRCLAEGIGTFALVFAGMVAMRLMR
jgi:hypothetical protein